MRIIGGRFKSRTLVAPKSLATRPSISMLRETLFNICQNHVEEALFLDLFAGSGAVGIEAISRGAQSVVFIDSSRESIKSIEKNIDSLDIGAQTQIIAGDVLKHLKTFAKIGKQFDLIFADPPYDYPNTQELVQIVDTTSLLKAQGRFFLETDLDFKFLNEFETLTLKRTKKFGKTALHELLRNESK